MLISARNGRDPKRRARDRGSAQSRVGVSHVGIPGKSGLNSLTMRFPATGWQNLASDQLTPTPKIILRTMFSQLKWCENPENFSSDHVFTAEMV